MAIMELRRWDDNVLISDICTEFSGMRWQAKKATHVTIAGNTIPQKISVMERWWDATFYFATDDPVNTLARYDRLFYDYNNDDAEAPIYFKFTDIDGISYQCRCMLIDELEREDYPTAHVLNVPCTFKEAGFIP